MLNHPIVILEGGDGTGKTSLANNIISGKNSGHYLHLTYNGFVKDHMEDYMQRALSSAVILSEYQPVVIDRWVMSELVYSNVFRNGTTLRDPYGMLANAAIMGVTFVNCHPRDRERYLSSFDELKTTRSEMYDSMLNVYDEYKRQIKKLDEISTSVTYDRFTHSLMRGQTILETAYERIQK